MQRTIEIADFELPRGAIPIADLMAMPRSQWEHLRSKITERRALDPTRPLARCRMCGGSVYIRAQVVSDAHLPVYAHFPESLQDCPWHQGPNLTPDDARAAQYRGHQESALHRHLCELVADLLRRDSRSAEVKIERYLRPSIAERGRYPDVYADMGDLGRFAIEVQLSKPFMPEIVGRHLHYKRESVSLLWLFHDLPVELPQGFRDVITMQRGNIFLFDATALAASLEGGRLVLQCLLENDRGGYLKPKMIELTELQRGRGGSVYHQDRRTERLLDYCNAGRAKWWPAFKAAPPGDFDDPFSQACFGPAWDSIKSFVPGLCEWKRQQWLAGHVNGERLFLELAAILFSIAHTAKVGHDHLYLTRLRGEGTLGRCSMPRSARAPSPLSRSS